MSADPPVRAVLLDAMGTLLSLEDPVPALHGALRDQLGIAVDVASCRHAVAREIAYYRRHLGRGGTEAGLAALRRDCGGVLRAGLGPAAAGVSRQALADVLVGALRFRAFDDVAPALAALSAHGLVLGVVSNWDRSLHAVLERLGLSAALATVVTSAEVGVAKPDPRPWAVALERLGCAPDHALHVGDSPGEDIVGARAAGLRVALIDRAGGVPDPAVDGVPVLRSLGELAALIS